MSRSRTKRAFGRYGGLLTVVASVGSPSADLAAILVADDYNPLSQSISALAVGQNAWIEDSAVYLLSLGFLGLSAATVATLPHGRRIWPGTLLLLLAVDLFVIGYFNEYAGARNRGADIHRYAVYALAALFLLAVATLATALALGRAWTLFAVTVIASWFLLAPMLKLVPLAWFGAWERMLGLMIVVWLGWTGWSLAAESPRARPTRERGQRKGR